MASGTMLTPKRFARNARGKKSQTRSVTVELEISVKLRGAHRRVSSKMFLELLCGLAFSLPHQPKEQRLRSPQGYPRRSAFLGIEQG
jgi:hypothetical protein